MNSISCSRAAAIRVISCSENQIPIFQRYAPITKSQLYVNFKKCKSQCYCSKNKLRHLLEFLKTNTVKSAKVLKSSQK